MTQPYIYIVCAQVKLQLLAQQAQVDRQLYLNAMARSVVQSKQQPIISLSFFIFGSYKAHTPICHIT